MGKAMTCYKCGKKEIGNIYCSNEHYICDSCHSNDIFDLITEYVKTTQEGNPFVIAEQLMENELVPMLGCENAWIAAGAFLAALRNEGTIKVSDDHIDEVFQRTRKQAVGGYCGLTGVCGVAPAIGACFSVLLGAACPKDEETSKTMYVVRDIINSTASLSGPCCCKAFVRNSLNIAVEYARVLFDIEFDTADSSKKCTYVERHPHGCRRDQCPFSNH